MVPVADVGARLGEGARLARRARVAHKWYAAGRDRVRLAGLAIHSSKARLAFSASAVSMARRARSEARYRSYTRAGARRAAREARKGESHPRAGPMRACTGPLASEKLNESRFAGAAAANAVAIRLDTCAASATLSKWKTPAPGCAYARTRTWT